MDTTHELAAILRDARKSALLRMRFRDTRKNALLRMRAEKSSAAPLH
jgi:hypothetical protein